MLAISQNYELALLWINIFELIRKISKVKKSLILKIRWDFVILQVEMGVYDFIILGVGVIALVTGALKGLVHQMGTIAGLICAMLACRFFGDAVADFFVSPTNEHATLLRALVYIMLFLLVFFGIALLARLLGAALSAVKLRVFDRVCGALFRLLLWMLFVSIAANIYIAVSPSSSPQFYSKSKPWRTTVTTLAPEFLGYITG